MDEAVSSTKHQCIRLFPIFFFLFRSIFLTPVYLFFDISIVLFSSFCCIHSPYLYSSIHSVQMFMIAFVGFTFGQCVRCCPIYHRIPLFKVYFFFSGTPISCHFYDMGNRVSIEECYVVLRFFLFLYVLCHLRFVNKNFFVCVDKKESSE